VAPGISKARARLDGWPKELAPAPRARLVSPRAGRWAGFARRYRAELRLQAAALAQLRAQAGRQRVTLLYGARDAHALNHAQVLRCGAAPPTLSAAARPRARPRLRARLARRAKQQTGPILAVSDPEAENSILKMARGAGQRS
jgi:uncharacterized protein YeaO (DUF488 family)